MNISKGLEFRKQELIDIQADIDAVETVAEKLKPAVQSYNNLKERISKLKKLKRQKQHELQIVVGFFQSTEQHYLDKIYPLFEGNQDKNRRTDTGQRGEESAA
ncbi:MAG: hypothetical protein Kow0098_03280 [Ignavibacteriaceae bacterium]